MSTQRLGIVRFARNDGVYRIDDFVQGRPADGKLAEPFAQSMAEDREAIYATGAPPRSGWARMVAELHVNNLGASLAFWRDVLGFATAFQRPEEQFAYLEHPEGHQIMLCQRNGRFETGPLDFPLGQGAMFQIYFESIEPVLSALDVRNWPIYLGPREVWRRTGDCESGQREVFLQDPDGYLLMVAENIGQRPLSA